MTYKYEKGKIYTSQDLMFGHIVLHYPDYFQKIENEQDHTVTFNEYRCIEDCNITSEPF